MDASRIPARPAARPPASAPSSPGPGLARRAFLLSLPALAAGCAGGGDTDRLPPLVSGYRHLTPIRLNVAEIEILDPAPGAVRVDEPAPMRPEREMQRMAQDRLAAMGTEGKARFLVQAAEFRRSRVPTGGGLTGLVAEPGERLNCRLAARLEVLSGAGQRVGFVEAEARRIANIGAGTSQEARRRAAEDLLRQGMDDLNVEFEFQVRRALRPWLVEAAAAASPDIGTPGGIEREDLPRR